MTELERVPPQHPQVFVNFCKDELGDNFVTHLVWALRDSGINVFTDSYKLRGREEQQEVFTSIEKSSITLVIFSKRYSESGWCLNELVKIEKLGINFTNTKERFAMEPMMVQSWEESLKTSTTGRIGLSLEAHMY